MNINNRFFEWIDTKRTDTAKASSRVYFVLSKDEVMGLSGLS